MNVRTARKESYHMKKVRIIIDSTCDLPFEIKEKLTVVPLTVRFGEDEYVDGVTIDYKEFYEKLIECDTLPSTSQATVYAFTDVFAEAVSAGEQVVALTISSKLSGTHHSAVTAAADFPDDVFVVDARNVSLGIGILAMLALRLAEEGISAAEIAAILTAERENVCVVALFDTLEYLKKGGRISSTAAMAGGILSLKPVITVRDGEIAVLGKARGSRQGNNFLIKEIEAAGGIDFSMPLLLGYSGLSDHLLLKYKEDSTSLWQPDMDDLPITTIGSVVGTYAGPGAIAVAFFKK